MLHAITNGGRRMRGLPVAMLAAAIIAPEAALACSTFCLYNDGKPIFGKNYDWSVDDGLVIVNKRGVSKTALMARPAAAWTSKYGSVTFNQYGRELPSGGINEEGLTIELMWLDETGYAGPDARPGVSNMQWIQYQLDTHATVDEVIASDTDVRVVSGGTSKIHYLVCDAGGHCASIEFLDGKMVAHTGITMPYTALTNSTYEQSRTYLEGCSGFGGSAPIPGGTPSLARFARAANSVRLHPSSSSSVIDYAFETLADVAQGEYTKWSIVYDIEARRVYWRTYRKPQTRYVDLERLDFACATPVRILDINTDALGDVTGDFTEYTEAANRNLIGRTFYKTEFLRSVPSANLDALARYPSSHSCDAEAAASE